MNEFISRNQLREDLMGYATCMYKPTLMAREKVLFVVDNIPEAIVRCRDCESQQTCKIAQRLGNEGYCSEGERKST